MIRRRIKKLLRGVKNAFFSSNPSTESTPVYQTSSAPPVVEEDEEEEVDLEVEAKQIEKWIADGENPFFVDIRQPHEIRGGYIPKALLIPMNQIPSRLSLFPTDRPIVLYCAAGARSFGLAHFMREKGFENSWSLIGGVAEWREFYQPPNSSGWSILENIEYEGQPATVQNVYVEKDATLYDILLESGEMKFGVK